MSNSSTQGGWLSKFSRGDYNAMEQKPVVDLVMFEAAGTPLKNAILNPKK